SSGGIVAASSFELVGGYASSGTLLGPVRTKVPPTTDPLRWLPTPNPTSYPLRSAVPLTINSLLPTVLSPGVYKGGISIKGASVVTMLPGEYVMDGGGFQVSGAATLTAVSVMLYNGGAAPGPIQLSTSGAVVWSAPLTGVYSGVSFFQDRAVAQPVQI